MTKNVNDVAQIALLTYESNMWKLLHFHSAYERQRIVCFFSSCEIVNLFLVVFIERALHCDANAILNVSTQPFDVYIH